VEIGPSPKINCHEMDSNRVEVFAAGKPALHTVDPAQKTCIPSKSQYH
jgi:hypothetical protein